MPPIRPPLDNMQFRSEGLASAGSATYGRVRNNGHRNHQGWDLAAQEGTPCFAIAEGEVIAVGEHPDFGHYVNIQFSPHGPANSSNAGDTYFAFYAHLSAASVSVGAHVQAGQVIGRSGSTGNAAGGAPHLHFEIRTVSTSSPGLGLGGRVDPGAILGYHHYQSNNTAGRHGPLAPSRPSGSSSASVTPAHPAHPAHPGNTTNPSPAIRLP